MGKPGLGREVRLPKDRCTNCKREMDAASVIDEVYARPKPGDFTICISCGHIMAFDDKLRLRELSWREMRQAAGDKRIVRASTALKMMWDAIGRPT